MGRRELLRGRAPLHLLLLCHAWALPPAPRDAQPLLPSRLPAPPGQLALRLAAFGRAFVLRLRPDAAFLSPVLRLQCLGGRRWPGRSAPRRDCFYAGAVEGNPDAPAVLNRCGGGLRAAFLLDGAAYELQPLGHHPSAGPPWRRPHRLQRRAAPPGWFRAPAAPPGSVRAPAAPPGWFRAPAAPPGSVRAPAAPPGSVRAPAAPPGWFRAPAAPPGSVRAPGQPLRRGKRFVSQARYVETLLVADASMVRFYGEDVENHVLTLMSMAAHIYKHPSLKNSISLVVVKVLVVDEAAEGPEVSDNGGLTLRNFCSWQQKFNPPSDRHPEHYDTAILLTRQDFCGHQSCDTLGVADIGTMCDRNKSCSVIEDEGLQAAYTLAHELGHVLSMPHDDSKTCERLFGPLGKHHMMAPLFIHLNKSQPWSPCSAMYLTEFLDGGHGDCLLDAPAAPLSLPAELPGRGALYSLDQQCQQIFGKDFQHCPNTTEEDICAQLWCRTGSGEPLCHTKNGSLPWADGTPCKGHGLCWDGHCMPQDALKPQVAVNGGWGPWSPWGSCSRSCGGGVQFSYRLCDSPKPQHGGGYCEGQRAKYQSCHTEECPPHGKSFREQQCEKYNSYNFTDQEGNLLEWVPKYAGVSPRDRCKLFCRARGRSEFKVFEAKVIDGTLCGPETLSICVHGQCIKAGCDHIVGSSKKLDKCGVCGGNGSTCRKISGSLNRSKYGYNDIVTIPAGATNIDIKQRSHRGVRHDGNYLALRTLEGKYLLNGDFAISAVEQDIFINGTILKYSGSMTTLERLQSFRQLPEALTVQLLTIASEVFPPKVKYTFFIPKDVPFSKQKGKEKKSANVIQPMLTSQWVLGDWSECSKTCGSGWQRRTVDCRDVEGQTSSTCDRALKPEDIKPCGDVPCPLWRLGPWSPCSQTCGQGVRVRDASCIDYAGKVTAPEKCSSPGPPPATAPCVLQQC
ncbi:A disintegrin and metalloproteinase with thrombospondin motifs 8 [Colius striatus]|uniref:A disintegrin and metalloproteinase with thrombospondin motifs 8 n=1 Tax=Colius striatus TaxID=57412 RepID=UPI002B1DE8C4|nr:A disintegrin and metalloproteinase with thrombospondin motifs 8 [Colius striatus]